MTALLPDGLEFVRTPDFERDVAGLLDEDDLRYLEATLLANPRAGPVIPGAGGVRKLRVRLEGRERRGGGRVIYLYVEVRQTIHLLMAYAKNDRQDLTTDDRRLLYLLAAKLRDT